MLIGRYFIARREAAVVVVSGKRARFITAKKTVAALDDTPGAKAPALFTTIPDYDRPAAEGLVQLHAFCRHAQKRRG